ncbi:MAG: glycosyltransferase family 2 protein [Lentisphaerae bacterium]|nr:glycosyltransferase family 2 protein [Lentisphaerota bacterium]
MAANKASVILLAKNPGPKFPAIIQAVIDQETPWAFDILVMDSGSTDGTVERIRALPGVRLETIPPASFGHGRTRNLAISKTAGEFVALITHDAMPANRRWLRNLVSAAEQAPDVAGAIGRQLPCPGLNPFIARDMNLFFDQIAAYPSPIFRIEDRARYNSDESYRQILHFFSNCNSCIRRSVWEKIPFPDVDFAEDQIWAKKAIEAGYAKAYSNDAAVYHSHDFSIRETARRAFDEAGALHRLFGYSLCPGLDTVARQWLALTMNDMRFAARNHLFRRAPRSVLRAPALNMAKMLGYFFGQRSKRIPKALSRYLSRDDAIKRGTRKGG